MQMPGIELVNGQFVFTAPLGLRELKDFYSKASAMLENIGKKSGQPDSSWKLFSSYEEAHNELKKVWAIEMARKEPHQEPIVAFPGLLLNQEQKKMLLEVDTGNWFHAHSPRSWEDFEASYQEMCSLSLWGELGHPQSKIARARWAVWEAGYCLAGSFKGQMFVY